ncbi:Uncharacterised protein [uncultured archaeon]|nr:Uncharacterised protein [uncultured archaeon]
MSISNPKANATQTAVIPTLGFAGTGSSFGGSRSGPAVGKSVRSPLADARGDSARRSSFGGSRSSSNSSPVLPPLALLQIANSKIVGPMNEVSAQLLSSLAGRLTQKRRHVVSYGGFGHIQLSQLPAENLHVLDSVEALFKVEAVRRAFLRPMGGLVVETPESSSVRSGPSSYLEVPSDG